MTVKNKKRILIVVLFIMTMFFGSYIYALNSDAYKSLISTLKSNNELVSKYNITGDIRLSFINYKIRMRGSDSGTAKFHVTASTKEGEVDLYAELKKNRGEWVVISLKRQ